jgi:hypothetical protein
MSIRNLLAEAHAHAATYLETVADRHVGGTCDRRELMARLGGRLPEGPSDPHTALANARAPLDRDRNELGELRTSSGV